ncbi:MAG: DUF58 domain-containing protein [Bacteroidetes bacterium]|nr:DUF58 domain-containing protein [Bacteroidota bacterium]
MSDIQELEIQFSTSRLDLIAKQVVEGFITGLHRSPYHGFSVEFAEHKQYNEGESIKHIDWKLFARTEKLFVKRFEEETNLRSHILIDTSSSMLFPYRDKKVFNKLKFSVLCSASLIYLLRKQRDAVGLSLFSDKIELHTRSKLSVVHSQLLFSELEKLLSEKTETSIKGAGRKKTKTATTLHQIAENIHQRSLIILFSDMMDNEDPDEVFSALQHLRYNKHEVILFHVFDSKLEEKFEFRNRPYRFLDMETGEELKLNPNDYRKDYINSVNSFFEKIKLKCGQYKIDLVEADIRGSFNDILMAYLVRRNKLY